MKPFKAKIPEEYSMHPVISKEAIELHYSKHHCGYATALNQLIENTPYENYNLEEIIIRSRTNSFKIFNAAAQLFNHNFYWQSLLISAPYPKGNFQKAIENQFGNFEVFLTQYFKEANSLFGSGWSWLVADQNDKFHFLQTTNAETPLGNPLLRLICVIDLWEHAYYLDYKNNRTEYLKQLLNLGINWNICELRFNKQDHIEYTSR